MDETNYQCYGSTTGVSESFKQVKSGSPKSKSGGSGGHPIICSAYAAPPEVAVATTTALPEAAAETVQPRGHP